MDNIIISHNDLDGLISSAIAHKCLNNAKTFFTSNLSFKLVFLKAISRLQEYRNIYFFDLSIREDILKISSVLFRKIVWIDHHINEKVLNFQNLETIIDYNAKSASELVSKYFNFFSDWIEIVNEIDSNNCKSDESRIIRDYFSYLRIKYGKLYNRVLSILNKKILDANPKDFIKKEEVRNVIKEFEDIKKTYEEFINENLEIKNLKNFKVAIIESKTNIPPYIVYENVKFKNDVDFLIIIYRGLKGVKLEFRSFKDFDVHKIAKIFNGGGHIKASGAYFLQNLTKSQILAKIEEVL